MFKQVDTPDFKLEDSKLLVEVVVVEEVVVAAVTNTENYLLCHMIQQKKTNRSSCKAQEHFDLHNILSHRGMEWYNLCLQLKNQLYFALPSTRYPVRVT